MNNAIKDQCLNNIRCQLKGATATIQGTLLYNIEIEGLLINQEHVIWQQAIEIEELKRRLKEFESLDFTNEKILHIQNINLQLKTQIEFLRNEIIEKDSIIASITCKPLQLNHPEMLLNQQNPQQFQTLDKDSLSDHQQQQGNMFDQLINRFQMNFVKQNNKVGFPLQSSDPIGIFNELQQYPEALQEIIERIIKEYRRIQGLIEQKDIENQNLQAQLQQRVYLQQQNPVDNQAKGGEGEGLTIQAEEKNKLQEKLDQTENNNQLLTSLIEELQSQMKTYKSQLDVQDKKLISFQNSNSELQIKLDEYGQVNIGLQQRLEDLQEKAIKHSQQIRESQKELEQNSSNSEIYDQKQHVATKQEKLDDLVREHLSLDDLINELEIKLVEKNERKEGIIEKILEQDVIQQEELLKQNWKQQNTELTLKQAEYEKTLKPKRNDFVEGISLQKVSPYNQANVLSDNEKTELQNQINLNNLQIAALNKEIVTLKENVVEKDKVIDEKDRELKKNQLIQSYSEMCEKTDDLVKKNIEIEELVNNLERKYAEKQLRAGELQQQLQVEQSLQNIQEPLLQEGKKENTLSLEGRPQVEFQKQLNSDLALKLAEQEKSQAPSMIGDPAERYLGKSQTIQELEQAEETLKKKIKQMDGELNQKQFELDQLQQQIKQHDPQELSQIVKLQNCAISPSQQKNRKQIKIIDQKFREPFQNILDKEEFSFDIGSLNPLEESDVNYSPEQIKCKQQKTKLDATSNINIPIEILKNYEYLIREKESKIEELQNELNSQGGTNLPLNYQMSKPFDNQDEEIVFQLQSSCPDEQQNIDLQNNQSDDQISKLNTILMQQSQQIQNLKEQIKEFQNLPGEKEKELSKKYQEQLSKSDELVRQNVEITDAIIELEEILGNKKIDYENLKNQLNQIQGELEDIQNQLKILEFYKINQELEEEVNTSPKIQEQEQISGEQHQLTQQIEGTAQQPNITLKINYEKKIKALKTIIRNLELQLKSQQQHEKQIPQQQLDEKNEQKQEDQFNTNLNRQNELIEETAALQDIITSLELKIAEKKQYSDRLEKELNQFNDKGDSSKLDQQLQESATMASTIKLDQQNIQQQYEHELLLARLKDKMQALENENIQLKKEVEQLKSDILVQKEELPTRDEFQNQQFLLTQTELQNKQLVTDVKQLEDQLHYLQQRISNQQEQAIQLSQEIRKSFQDSNSSNSQIKDTRLKILEKQQKADELVKEHLSLEDLIADLERKLVEKNDYKDQLIFQLKEPQNISQQQPIPQEFNQTIQLPSNQIQHFNEISDVQAQSQKDDQISIPFQAGQLLDELNVNANQIQDMDLFKHQALQEQQDLHPAKSQPVFSNVEQQIIEPKLQAVRSTQGFSQPRELLSQIGLDEEKVSEMLTLVKNNNDVEKKILELKLMLSRKTKRKDQLEGVIQQRDSTFNPIGVQGINEKKDLQNQVHQKNLQIAALNEELMQLKVKIFEKEKVIDEKDREFRNSQLVKSYQESCDKVDELVQKNIEIEELVNNLECKLAEKQERAKELQQCLEESSISNLQEPRVSGMIIKSYDQEQDLELQQQEQVLSRYTINMDQLRNRIDLLTGQLSEKQAQNEQLCNQVSELKKQIHGFSLAQQDVKIIKKQNKQLQEQVQELVEENLNYEDLIRDSQFKLEEKKSKVKELDFEIKNAEISFQLEKQKKEEETLQQKILQTDELIKRNLEMDEALTSLELRLLDKQQQLYAKEAKVSNQSSRILQQPLYIYQEDSDEKNSNIKTETSPKASQHQNYLIQEHNNNLSEMQSSISQMQEQVRQLTVDDSEFDFFLQQKKGRQAEIEQLKQQLQQQQDQVQDLKSEQIEKQEQIVQLKKENANFDELVLELQCKQKKMIEQEIQKEAGQFQDVVGTDQEIEKAISENFELTKKLHDLKSGEKKLKSQIVSLDSIIIDLETVVTEKKNEMQRISRDNQLYQTQNRKQKARRDQLHKEQSSLQSQLRLLEPQIMELQQTEKQQNDLIAELKEKLNQLTEQNKQIEMEIIKQQQNNSELQLNLKGYNNDLSSELQKQKDLQILLQQFRKDNQEIEQEVIIYRDLNLEDRTLSDKIDEITVQIKSDNDIYQTLLQEQKEAKEQIDLLIPEKLEIEEMKDEIKSQYLSSVEGLNQLQEDLKKIVERKNNTFQEISDITTYLEDNKQVLQDLINEKINCEENIKKEQILFNAIKDKTSKLEEELNLEKQKLFSQQTYLAEARKEQTSVIQQIEAIKTEVNKIKLENDKFQQQKQDYENQKAQIEKLQQDIDLNLLIIPEKEEQIGKLQEIVLSKQDSLNSLQTKVNNLETEFKTLSIRQEDLKAKLLLGEKQLENLSEQISSKKQKEESLQLLLNSIELKDLESALNSKMEQQFAQQELLESIEQLKQQFENEKLQEGNIIQMIENQQNLNNEHRQQLENSIKKKDEIDQELHSTNAQLEEMTFQMKSQSEQLDKLNDQFKKVDEDSKMMEAVLQLKEKELRQLQRKKETITDELERINNEVVETQKQLATRRKKQKSLGAEPDEQEEEVDEDIQGKITSLNSKNNDLKDDLQKLVKQNPENTEQQQGEAGSQPEKINQDYKDREKRIETLEITIKTLKEQNIERISNIPSSMFKGDSRISVQPTFFFDDDPLLLELQEKFSKESELLKDLQNKIRSTAESHYSLSLQLKEWAEKENRLAKELDSRRQSVEQIEQEIQSVFAKQTDLESEKVEILQRIYQLEIETQELLEQEGNVKNKLKEKKDYLQTLYKNLTESDSKLLQLRNRMAIYSQEGRQLAEQVEHFENERENKLMYLQDIQEELDHVEIEKSEKQVLISSIKKEISESQLEKENLETEFAIVHSKNLQLKGQIGFEEALYQKLLQELEISKKRDQAKYQNFFSDGSAQTEYDMDQFEALLNGTQMVKITRDDIAQLKEGCQRKLVEIYSIENQNIQKAINGNKDLKKMIHLQQMMITIQENENQSVIEQNSRRSSKLGFKVLDETIYNVQFTLEQIDSMMNKTRPVEVQLNDNQIQIGENKLARQWIIEKQFDYDNSFYPLGVLNIIYKVSLYQVINISLTGTKVLNLYQQIL